MRVLHRLSSVLLPILLGTLVLVLQGTLTLSNPNQCLSTQSNCTLSAKPFLIQAPKTMLGSSGEVRISILTQLNGTHRFIIKLKLSDIEAELPGQSYDVTFNKEMTKDGWQFGYIDWQSNVELKKKYSEIVLKIGYLSCPKQMSNTSDFSKIDYFSTETECAIFWDTLSITIIEKKSLVLGELEKPQYRQGEQVRFRFIAFSNDQLSSPMARPNSKQYRLAIVDDKDRKSKLIWSNSVYKEAELYFSSIHVENPRQQLMKAWNNLTILKAANLSYQLLADASEGEWKITAQTNDGEKEILKFVVEQYVLPRFLVDITGLSDSQIYRLKKDNITYKVCAKYSQGRAMQGEVETQLCACDYAYSFRYDDTESNEKKLAFFKDNKCPNNKEAPLCIATKLAVDSQGCATFSTPAIEFTQTESNDTYMSSRTVTLKVKFEETGTKSTVGKFVQAGRLEYTEVKPNLNLKMPSVFRPHLPVNVLASFDNPTAFDEECRIKGPKTVEIRVFATENDCGFNFERKLVHALNIVFNNSAPQNFTIGPFPKIEYLTVVGYYEQNITIRSGFYGKQHKNTVREASASSKVWLTSGDLNLQRWPKFSDELSETIAVTPSCPATYELDFVSNRPFSNRTMFLEFLSSNKGHTLRELPQIGAADSEKCTNQDGYLGHYTCVEGKRPGDPDELQCLPNWYGENCLQPFCSDDCQRGVCARPGVCLCETGWSGKRCDVCIKRENCVNGVCKNGDDCVCEEGWFGPICDNPMPDHLPFPRPATSVTIELLDTESPLSEQTTNASKAATKTNQSEASDSVPNGKSTAEPTTLRFTTSKTSSDSINVTSKSTLTLTVPLRQTINSTVNILEFEKITTVSPKFKNETDVKIKPTKEELVALKTGKPIRTRRSIFFIKFNLTIDASWGYSTRAVSYYIDKKENHSDYVLETFSVDKLWDCATPLIALDRQSGRKGLSFSRSRPMPGSDIRIDLNLPVTSTSTDTKSSSKVDRVEVTNKSLCYIRLSDVALDSLSETHNPVDIDMYIQKLNEFNSYKLHWYGDVQNSVEAFQWAGLTAKTFGQLPIFIKKQIPCPVYHRGVMMEMAGPPGADNQPFPLNSGPIYFDQAPPKPRLRKVFPEVWLFEAKKPTYFGTNSTKQFGLYYNTTVPDTITSWRLNAFCFLDAADTLGVAPTGLWIGSEDRLMVEMPFFIEIIVPKQVKRGELVHLPVSVFAYNTLDGNKTTVENMSENGTTCYKVKVTWIKNPNWSVIFGDKHDICVCEGRKETVTIKIVANTIGESLATVEAIGKRLSIPCNSNDDIMSAASRNESLVKPKYYSDAVQRKIKIIPEGQPSVLNVNKIFCSRNSSDSEDRLVGSFELTKKLPTTVVKDSVRAYISATGDVMGSALANLESLVSLPVGCGEQNMVLLAPNVYVLNYLSSVPSDDYSSTQKLSKAAAKYIEIGVTREMDYRRDDGSFSAFGKSDPAGSTWLTAFVIRVFGEVRSLSHLPTLLQPISWNFNLTAAMLDGLQFLQSIQDEDGCFEEKGRIIHTEMKGSQSSTDASGSNGRALLTAFVLSSLLEANISTLRPTLNGSLKKGFACIEQIYNLDNKLETEKNLAKMSNYAMSQYAYAFSKQNQNGEITKALYQELQLRKSIFADGEYNAWTSVKLNTTTESDFDNPAAVETTAYVFLTMVELNKSIEELIPLMSWLSSKQKYKGGFFSTQDTVLALKTMTQFGQLLYINSSPKKPVNASSSRDIDIMGNIEPLGFKFKFKISPSNRRLFQQLTTGYQAPKELKQVKYEISGEGLSSGCARLQSSVFFSYIPADKSTVDPNTFPFNITVNIEKKAASAMVKENRALVSVCIELNKAVTSNTGMVVASISMLTGWSPDVMKIKLPEPNNLMSYIRYEVDFDEAVTFYFDGFGQSEDGKSQANTRCAALPLVQKVFADELKPAFIRVYDYYAPEVFSETPYQINFTSSDTQQLKKATTVASKVRRMRNAA